MNRRQMIGEIRCGNDATALDKLEVKHNVVPRHKQKALVRVHKDDINVIGGIVKTADKGEKREVKDNHN
jgi:hypothetical protein